MSLFGVFLKEKELLGMMALKKNIEVKYDEVLTELQSTKQEYDNLKEELVGEKSEVTRLNKLLQENKVGTRKSCKARFKRKDLLKIYCKK